MEARQQLLAMVIDNKGDWKRTISDINDKKSRSDDYIKSLDVKDDEFITIIDEDYPERLKTACQPPFLLFYKGRKELLKSDKLLAVVNDKTATKYADDSIFELCSQLIENCVFVLMISTQKQIDLAKKILEKNGQIIAVLNKPIGIEYQTDKELYQELEKNHLIISTIPKTYDKSNKESWVECYRTIASLTSKVLVGAVSKNSAQIIAIACALQMGADVFCIPFPLGSNYIGNSLIHDGAIIVENAQSLLFDGGFDKTCESTPKQ